jgi:hypothetical protein
MYSVIWGKINIFKICILEKPRTFTKNITDNRMEDKNHIKCFVKSENEAIREKKKQRRNTENKKTYAHGRYYFNYINCYF